MKKIKNCSKLALLFFAALVAIVGGTSTAKDAEAGRFLSTRSKLCYHGGLYSLGACLNGQRCVRGVNNEDYWEDDDNCPVQNSPGGGGMQQV